MNNLLTRTIVRQASFLLVLVATWMAAASHAPAQVRVEASEVALVSAQKTVEPGKSFEVGIFFRMDNGWHTYWKNGGDVGFPARVAWHLPDGFSATTPRWPVPEKRVIDGLVNYIFEHELLLPVTITPPKNLTPGTNTRLSATVNWLMCLDICIPGTAELALELPVAATAAPDDFWQARFRENEGHMPTPLPPGTVKVEDIGDHYKLEVGADLSTSGSLSFYPGEDGLVHHIAAQITDILPTGTHTLHVEKDPYGPADVKSISGLLVDEAGQAYAFEAPLVTPPSPRQGGEATTKTPSPGLWLALGGAFLAGLLLNLMPCVLPVLALKVMGLVRHAHGHHRVGHAWLFVAGVLTCFWGLAALLVALRAGGEGIGWGFQLQNPGFVAFLTIVLWLLALEFFGVYEVGHGLGRLQGGRATSRGGALGAFATGVLMTLVATPCTVPFMGTAMAYGLSRSALEVFLVFGVLGAGMALPYLLLALRPGWLKFVPKPGRWMLWFKRFLGIPMGFTALWLGWVFWRQVGEGQGGILLIVLIFTGLAAALFGRWGGPGVKTPWRQLVGVIFGVALGASTVFSFTYSWRSVPQPPQLESGWQSWSVPTVAEARREGRPVFVNFTADWCLTCRVGERLVLHTPEAEALFTRNNVLCLTADWTRPDPAIAAELERHGRRGVPLYLYYPVGAEKPVVLPQLFTLGTLREVIESKR